jgi:FkbH-like protein
MSPRMVTNLEPLAVEPAPPAPGRQNLTPQPQDSKPPFRLAIAATFTAEPLEETLRYWERELHWAIDVQFAPYNQVLQQLLDPASLLGANRNGLNLVLLRLEDLASPNTEPTPAVTAEGIARMEHNTREMVSALKSALQRGNGSWQLWVCPASKAALATRSLPDALARLEQLLATELSGHHALTLLTPADLFQLYPDLDYDDPQANQLGHVPYTPAGYAALGTLVARKAHALHRPPRKVIAVDCDQTLWAGICGEDGPGGVQLQAPHRALQLFLRSQFEAGALLCLCSKNNPADVAEVFRRRNEMPLRPEHFAAQRINWRPKSENLHSLAQELNLGLDSFTLLDDNPVECAEVEANCPEVLVLPLPEDPASWTGFLEHVWAFDRVQVTDEDRQRTLRYQQNRLREQFQATAPTLKDFLAGLQLQITIEPVRPAQVARLSQLTHRTNQFNCTTRRRSEEEIVGLSREPLRQLLAVTVSDRFGDYGLVGASFYRRTLQALEVDTFLLSCRVLGKGVEHRMLAHLGQTARQLGVERVDVLFEPSARNQPALDFLKQVGAAVRQGNDSALVFRFPAAVAAEVSVMAEATPAELMSAAEPQPGATPAANAPAARPPRYAWIARTARDPELILRLIEGRVPARPAPAAATQVPPQTETQRRLCQMWQEVLKLERVGIRDDFFELGGTSQLAVRVCARVEKQLGRKLPLALLFKTPTIEQLAKALEPD